MMYRLLTCLFLLFALSLPGLKAQQLSPCNSVACGGTGGTSGQTALTSLSGVYVLCRSSGTISHTGDANEVALGTCNVPANAMGSNGRLRVTFVGEWTNNADTKTFRVRYSGISGSAYGGYAVTTNAIIRSQVEIVNSNSTGSQIGFASGVTGFGSGGANVTSTVDTTVATSVVLTGQLGTTTDNIQIDYYEVELITTAGN